MKSEKTLRTKIRKTLKENYGQQYHVIYRNNVNVQSSIWGNWNLYYSGAKYKCEDIAEDVHYGVATPPAKTGWRHQGASGFYIDIKVISDEELNSLKKGDLINIPIESLEENVFDEALYLQKFNDQKEEDPTSASKLAVFSDEEDSKKNFRDTFSVKNKLKQAGFDWNGQIKKWTIPADRFEQAKELLSTINKVQSSKFVEALIDLEEYVANAKELENNGLLADKIDLYIQDLMNVTDEKAFSSEIRRYLQFISRFRTYSFFNGVLIFIQKNDATKVAGYNKWKEVNRGVKRGATRIQILAPRFSGPDPAKGVEDKDLADEIRRNRRPVNFFPVTVYDMSDTYPLNEKGEIPETPKWYGESGENEYADRLTDAGIEMAGNMGINVEIRASRGGEKGSSSGDNIAIVDDRVGADKFSVFTHELAHEMLHHKKFSMFYKDGRPSTEIVELQAESVSYVVCKHYKLPTEHQPTYLALWKADRDKIKKNLDIITKVSMFIIDGIDKYMK